jgi:hypothetical protein
VADVKLGLEDGFNELQGTVWAVGKIQVEKAKLKDRLLQAQARAALEAFEGLLPIMSPCDAKWAAYAVCAGYVQDGPGL